ncbi:MAG: protein TolQ [Methylococcales bacterium]|jgi:biopolymer transport protein TolQ|nr:protein TolQ [Methylococcales bacterium]MBT7408788.1 protein TolQ [Methylococcales bacterium]
MTADLSILHLVTQASPVVQFIMLLLIFASVASWTIIFARWKILKRARKDAEKFEHRFWSGTDLNTMYKRISSKNYQPTGMEKIFEAGFSEFARLKNKPGLDPMAVVSGAQRSMRVTLAREEEKLDAHLNFLATVGSTSPYVGLFGTVWGIMNSFRALGNMNQATISLVAPGIAEALIATAIGLFAAIPAVIAYNRFSYDVERLANRFDLFLEEFSTLLQRHANVNETSSENN